MTVSRYITFTYGLTYFATALAINGSLILSALIMALTIALIRVFSGPAELDPSHVVLLSLLTAATIMGFDCCRQIAAPLPLIMVLLLPFGWLHLQAVTKLPVHRQSTVLTGEGLLFAALAFIVIMADALTVRLTGHGVLTGFWFILLLAGINVLVPVLTCLISRDSQALKSKLSQS